MATAYSYLRFSSAIQASGDSVRRQTEATKAWCARNGVTLDASLALRDDGVSAFKGRHRAAENADTHALAKFLELVSAGRIPAGSYLVVESLDRLTREKIRPALTLLLQLIGSGIKVVQLTPVEAVYDDQVEPMQLMLAIMELNRGHSESAVKSERVGAAWRQKQRGAASKPVTRRTPNWIRAIGGLGKKMKDTAAGEVTFELIPERAEIVKRIFEMAIGGDGQKGIAQKLNAEKVPVFGRAHAWTATAIYQILNSRAAVGEYVAYTHKNKARPAKGEPVPGYFPAAVDAATFARATAGTKRRGEVGRGRRGTSVHLLSGLLIDARDGGSLTYWSRTKESPNIVTQNGKEGSGAWASIPADKFESAILSQFREIAPADVFGEAPTSEPLRGLETQLAEVDALVAHWTAKMDDLAIVHIVAQKLSELSARRATIRVELDRVRGEIAAPASAAWDDLASLADLAATADDETRLRIRAAVRRVVESIYVLIVPINKFHKVAIARVQFTSILHRYYRIETHRDRPTKVESVGALWSEIDIRVSDHARVLEQTLRADLIALTSTEDFPHLEHIAEMSQYAPSGVNLPST